MFLIIGEGDDSLPDFFYPRHLDVGTRGRRSEIRFEFCTKKVKKSNLILPMLLLAMATVQFPAMAATYTTEVTNNISMGDINIGIKEYEHDENGNEVAYRDGKMVVPGQKVDKIIRITNNANQAWIRAKLEYTDWQNFAGLSDNDVELASDKWVKVGDYYYYTEPVSRDASVDLIKSVSIPTDWTEVRSGGTFQIITTVDAVQTANFTPNFEAEDPWFGTVIEECVHTSHGVMTETGNETFGVIFENGSEGLVKVGDDFFSNWPSLMPGDAVTDTVRIGNNYSRPITIFFRTETIADDNLIGKVHLTIKNGEEVLYDGAMNGAITKEISLGYVKKGETKNLTYTVSIPAELTNEFALTKTKTKWIFRCFYGNSSGGSSGGGSSTKNSQGGPGVTPPETSEETSASTPEETTTPGDTPTTPTDIDKNIPRLGENKTGVIAITGVLAVLACGAAIFFKKKGEEKKE